jgi:hypothetical protein
VTLSCFLGCHENGATGGTRTHDLLITNQLLYQLSYGGEPPGHTTPCLLDMIRPDLLIM